MLGKRKRDVGDEAADFGTTLLAFLVTLGGLLRSTAEWLGLMGLDAVSDGAETFSGQAGSVARASRAKAKAARKRGRRALMKLAIVGGFLWWLDRDLSEPRP